jgi:hypothetical protein
VDLKERRTCLGTVGIRTGVSHGEKTGSGVLQFEILICRGEEVYEHGQLGTTKVAAE